MADNNSNILTAILTGAVTLAAIWLKGKAEGVNAKDNKEIAQQHETNEEAARIRGELRRDIDDLRTWKGNLEAQLEKERQAKDALEKKIDEMALENMRKDQIILELRREVTRLSNEVSGIKKRRNPPAGDGNGV